MRYELIEGKMYLVASAPEPSCAVRCSCYVWQSGPLGEGCSVAVGI